MKKFVALLLALTLCIGLCACGAQPEAPAATDAPAAEAPAEETPAATSETEATTGSKDIKVGFIFLHDENSTYDLNFINAAKAACAEVGLSDDQVMMKTNISESQACYDAAAELVDAGCDLIITDSFGHESFALAAAKEFPEVHFVSCTGVKAHTEGLNNFHNAFASIYEGRYLAGVAAGLKLNEMIENGDITAEEAKMGYVGAFPYAEVKSGYTSFFLGARSVCPSVTMEVTFTSSWYDEALEKEAANKLINNGCVLISQHADSMGAPTACETAGVPNVSYNGSTVAACPNTFIVSSRIDWTPFFVYAINCVASGEDIGYDWTGTLATGSVVLTDVNEQAAAVGTAEKIAEVMKALEDGSVKVFDTATFTVNGETVTTYLADVDDLGDYVGETEAISDGVFLESFYRSAPYFDLDIDGITNLDA